MNKNPLLIKSCLLERIPFIKGKTAKLYGRYLSNHRLNKTLVSNGSSETVSAFTMNTKYKLNDNQSYLGIDPRDFVFDKADVSSSKFFSEKEWVALGMVLRAYKEVEGVNLLHLYNCLYSAERNKIKGFVVTNRSYTLYSDTQLPVKLTLVDPNTGLSNTGVIKSISSKNPTIIRPFIKEFDYEKPVEIYLEFSGSEYQPCVMVEGTYRGLTIQELSKGTSTHPVPENLKIGEYSDKLVEFFAGTLVTPMSDSKLISNVGARLPGSGKNIWENTITNTVGLYNQDGYLDKRSKV